MLMKFIAGLTVGIAVGVVLTAKSVQYANGKSIFDAHHSFKG